MFLTLMAIPFAIMSLINLPEYIKKKDIGLSLILLMMLVASSLLIYVDIKSLLDAGYKWI